MPKPPIPAYATYESRLVNCGKERCGQCQLGASHGPYWFATWKEDGAMKHRYVGKKRPIVADPPAPSAGAARGRAGQPGPGIVKIPAEAPPARATTPV